MPSVALEVAPLDVADYRPLVEAGAEALLVIRRPMTLSYMPSCILRDRSGTMRGVWRVLSAVMRLDLDASVLVLCSGWHNGGMRRWRLPGISNIY